MKKVMLFLATAFLLLQGCQKSAEVYDICIYGGTSAGVIAAYTAKMMGKSVILIEPGRHLGGLTSGGLGQTDIGNKHAVTGLSRDFYRRVGDQYGVFEAWKFEPHVAEEVFNDYIRRGEVPVLKEYRIISTKVKGGWIKSIDLESSAGTGPEKTIAAEYFMDCSYEGDLLARAGVSYIVGREGNEVYGETLNGVQLMDGHQFPDSIDPYIVPGDPSSGLCWGISPDPLEPDGTGDSKLQAYNFRLCITKDPDNQIPITAPDDYDPAKYELLKRVILQREELGWIQKLEQLYLIISPMPNGKTDINNKGPMSTDFIGMNYDYPEADYDRRQEIIKEHEDYIKGLLYFLGHDPGLPDEIKDQMLPWGWAKDEFTDNGGFPHQMYVREARRMIGEFVMTEHHCTGDEVVDDGIGLAAYTMDSHNCQRIVVNGMVKNEGNVEVGGFPPYEISCRSLVPRADECKNLTVPVCLSASHIAFGSIRMEPVFMVLGQVAAVASCMALESDLPVQAVDVDELNGLLASDPLLDGTPPDITIDNADDKYYELTGSWTETHRWMRQYGHNYLVTEGSGDEARIVVKPEISHSGEYRIFYYCPGISRDLELEEWPAGVPVKISDVDGEKTVKVDVQSAERDFADLGRFSFEEGGNCRIEIVADEISVPVPFDALLLVPVK